jgi:hypothetical protein
MTQSRRPISLSHAPQESGLVRRSASPDIEPATVHDGHSDDLDASVAAAQAPVAEWHSRFPDPTIPDALLDRFVHHAYRLELRGEPQRKTPLFSAHADHLSV